MLRLVPINDPRRKRIGRAEQCLRSAQRCDISDARVKEHVHGPREQRARGAIAAACSIKQPPLPKHGYRTRTPVPEPAAAGVFAIGVALIARSQRRTR